MHTEMIITIIVTVIGSNALWGFAQFWISRKDKKHDKLTAILDAVKDVKADVDIVKEDARKQNAILARTHILRFKDELYNNIKHSSEYFEQTLDDIEVYEKYCTGHPDFANGRTKAATKYIREEYDRLFKEHKL